MMKRTTPAGIKLVICVWHPFTEWRPKPMMADAIRRRWPEMRVVHLPDYYRLPEEPPDTDIFVGYSLRATELNGQVLLIVGSGSIGRELARRAKAFDLRVWGVTRSGEGDPTHAERIVPASQLDEVLPQADYVVISAPETAETKRLIGAAQIARMKRGARLLNVARGSLLDEAALVRALESGAFGGAALAVP